MGLRVDNTIPCFQTNNMVDSMLTGSMTLSTQPRPAFRYHKRQHDQRRVQITVVDAALVPSSFCDYHRGFEFADLFAPMRVGHDLRRLSLDSCSWYRHRHRQK